MTDAIPARFWAKVDKTGDCWIWTGMRDPKGYARVKIDGRMRRGHRVSYEALVGPIPEGLVIDHLCRVRCCVNPDHMEPVTPAENTRRGNAGRVLGLRYSSRTHCPQGHPYDEANTRMYRGRRYCKACNYLSGKRRRAAAKAATLEHDRSS